MDLAGMTLILRNELIGIHRTVHQESGKSGVYVSEPKTRSSERYIKLPESVFSLLNLLKKEQNDSSLISDNNPEFDWVFKNKAGDCISPESVPNWFRKFCKRKNIRHVTLHSFRHLNATVLISQGIDIKTVSATLGHSQISTTLDIYAHALAETQARASEVLGEVFNDILSTEKVDNETP